MGLSENSKFIFDPIAERYDCCNRLFSLGMDRLWRKRLVKELLPQENSRVLDICTGTGDVVFDLLRYSAAKDITGTDVSESMIHLAQEKQILYCGKKWMQKAQITWGLQDAARMDFEASSFDRISCAFGIRNVADRQSAVRELFRVLKPGGKLGILEFSVPPNAVARKMYLVYLQRIMPFCGTLLLKRKEPLVYLSQSILKWHDVDFAAELRDAGFTKITRDFLTLGIVSLWIAQKA